MGSAASNLFTQNPSKLQSDEKDVPSFKIVLVGDPNVGKSAIFLRYVREQFDYSYQPTMAVNIGNVTKKIQVPFETLVSISLWDIPGREDIDLRRCYFKDVDAAIVVVDLSDKDSIEMAGSWKQDIYNNNFMTEEEGIRERKKSMKSQLQVPILLLGNKLDQVRNENGIASEIKLLEDIAFRHGFVGCVAVSARESDGGVHAAIRSLIRYLLQKNNPKKVKKFSIKQSNLNDIFNDSNLHNKFVQALGSVDDHTFQKLKLCNVNEIDNIIRTCEHKVHEVETNLVSFLIAVKNFKKSCCVSGIIDSNMCTIEECITNLNDTIKNEENDYLKVVEEADCVKLQVSLNTGDMSGALRRIIDIYNDEVCKCMHRIIIEFPNQQISLNELLNQLVLQKTDFSSLKGSQMGMSKNEIKYAWSCIEEDITRIKDTINLMEKSLKIANNCINHVKKILV